VGHLHSFVREPPWKSFLSGSADASPVLAGILFQLGTMTIFTVLALDLFSASLHTGLTRTAIVGL